MLCSFVVDDPTLVASQRSVMAAACFIRWIHVLLMLRGFAYFGPLLLPIINSVKQTMSFVIVLVFLLGAIFHGQVALSHAPSSKTSVLETLMINYRLAMHQDTVRPPNTVGESIEAASYMLFFTASIIVGIYT